MIEVHVLEVPGLGNRSYVVTDGATAIVVDPPRDVDRVFAITQAAGIAWVLETHLHNDQVSGGRELARLTGSHYGVSAAERLTDSAARVGLRDGDVVSAGTMRIRAVHTPGHTDHHLAYVLSDAVSDDALAVFSGGSWLHGTAGRTDLMGVEHAERLARAQWSSLRRLAAELPDSAAIHPTHGFGSFCAAGEETAGSQQTVGAARGLHPALMLNEQDFAAMLLRDLVAVPSYYARMAPLNRDGAPPIDLRDSPEASPEELVRRIDAGEWVLDLRPRHAFAAAHLAGSISAEVGDLLATYVGWAMPWGMPLTLAGESRHDVQAARRALARIGIDGIVAQTTAPFAVWSRGAAVRSHRVATFGQLEAARAAEPVLVLDVRRPDEWSAGHIEGAVHVPIGELWTRLDEVAAVVGQRTVWVHCAAGFRASMAASMLDARRVPAVLVNDTWVAAEATGLAMIRPARETALTR